MQRFTFISPKGISMNALLMTIDLMLATAAIYVSVQIQNVLWPRDGHGMTRLTRRWLAQKLIHHDHILVGAVAAGMHGLLALALAIAYMPYAALVVCVCAIWNSARLMQALACVKFQPCVKR